MPPVFADLREGMVLSDFDMTLFNRLRRKRLIGHGCARSARNPTIREHDVLIRNEMEGDVPTIRAIITEAMLTLPQATGTEADIVDGLRAGDALILSLVAEDRGEAVGYLAASMAQIGADRGWGLIGPLAVLPSRHGQGIGSALMAEAIGRLRATCKGAALVGDPRYYGRFGFSAYPGLGIGACPPEFVQALPFDVVAPKGELIIHPAFGLKQDG